MLPVLHHPDYDAVSVPEGHRFPMRKYSMLAERLRAAPFAAKLDWRSPDPARREQLIRAHDPAYVDGVLTQTLDPRLQRRIGFPVTPDVTRRSLAACGGTILACRLALAHGRAVNLAGGSHHASREGGAGFCVFNDVAVAALDLLAEGLVDRILVVDCDVHQGDGTARIFADDPRVFTMSVHCADNWPIEKPPSDLDVALPKGADDRSYLGALHSALREAFHRSRPQLVIYNAGVDPHADDRLGLLKLTDAGLRSRDTMVARWSRLDRNKPLAAVLGGGYGPDASAVAARHAILVEALMEAAETQGSEPVRI